MVPTVPPLGKKKQLAEGQKLSLLVNEIIKKIFFSIHFSLVENQRREESWYLHLPFITCFAFCTTWRLPIRLFSRLWLEVPWAPLPQTSIILIKIFFAAVWRSGDCSVHLHPEWLFRLFQAVCWLCRWLSNFILLYSIPCISFSFCSLCQLLFSTHVLFFGVLGSQTLFFSLWKIQIFTNSIIASNALESLCVSMAP